MSLQDFLATLDALESDAATAFDSASDTETLEDARIRFLGAKKGKLKDVQKQMGAVDDKKAAGMRLNQVKQAIQSRFDSAKERLDSGGSEAVDPTFDPTLPGVQPAIGHVHPITQTINHLMEIMGRMGFEAAEGPEVEDPWHNFVALNIPEDHPARDPLDNFYLATADAKRRATPKAASCCAAKPAPSRFG